MDTYKNIFSKCLIIDLGSGVTKAGLSHEENPKVILESLVGKPVMSRVIPSNKGDVVIGSKNHSTSLYRFEKPIKRGIIQNFDSVKLIIQKVLDELRIKSLIEIPIFFTEATGTPLSQRKKLTEMIFENFDANSLYFGNQAVLSLYSLGKTSGCVMDIGDGLTQVGCVYNGYKLDNSFDRADIGGSDIDSFLSLLLRKNGLYIKPQNEFALLKNIKETRCKLIDFSKQDMLQIADIGGSIEEDAIIVLPDGEEVKIGNERFLAPEILLKPDLVGVNSPGIHHLINGVIERNNMDLKNKLYKNIYLTGGSSNLVNLANRISSELKQIAPTNAVLSISTSIGRKDFHAWHGASIMSLSNDFSSLWIKKNEYKDQGESILVRKGF